MIRLLHVIASILGDLKSAGRGPSAFGRRKVRASAHRALGRAMRRSRWLRP